MMKEISPQFGLLIKAGEHNTSRAFLSLISQAWFSFSVFLTGPLDVNERHILCGEV